MDTVLFPYLASMVITIALLTLGAFAYVRFQGAANVHMLKSQRLPDFIQWTDLSEKIAGLEERCASLIEREAHALSLIDQANAAEKLLAENAANIEEARATKEKLRKTESELVTMQSDMALKVEELRKVTQDRDKAEFNLECLEKTVQSLGAEKEKLESESKRLVAANEDLEGQRRKNLEAAEALLKENAVLRAQVAGLEVRKDKLLEEVKELELRETRANTATTALEGEVQRLTSKKAGLEAEVGPIANQGFEERVAEIREPVFSYETLSAASQGLTEESALKSVERHLEAHELQFHPRVIRAFHTALKVQDESPLLVLAGISGTGKSLLPQRYAEALGIHCSVVPVQPRWDGPQDLLGFYHHLEGKFKATQLTRALLQFDRFCALDQEDSGLSDRMLMVLLDEMNLARIEDYFSEFLSRLEMRRDVNIEEEAQRSRCAVPLEIGTVEGEGSSNLDLVVDRNVLFVGTINEDESTQTLSEKVVDRANVMRFGRPRQLAQQAEEAREFKTASQQHLLRSSWESWIRDAAPLSRKDLRVEEIARRLNDALEGIGKAFGHRTFRAILAYARQYPGGDANRLEVALADQVEQRILPKLRGLDPSDEAEGSAISGILSVVESLNDSVLAEAVDHGRQGHAFLWQGVARPE